MRNTADFEFLIFHSIVRRASRDSVELAEGALSTRASLPGLSLSRPHAHSLFLLYFMFLFVQDILRPSNFVIDDGIRAKFRFFGTLHSSPC